MICSMPTCVISTLSLSLSVSLSRSLSLSLSLSVSLSLLLSISVLTVDLLFDRSVCLSIYSYFIYINISYFFIFLCASICLFVCQSMLNLYFFPSIDVCGCGSVCVYLLVNVSVCIFACFPCLSIASSTRDL